MRRRECPGRRNTAAPAGYTLRSCPGRGHTRCKMIARQTRRRGGIPAAAPNRPPFGWAAAPAGLPVEFGLLVQGDAMAPTYPHGSIALCGPWQTRLTPSGCTCYAIEIRNQPLPVLAMLIGATPAGDLELAQYVGRGTVTVEGAKVIRFAPVLGVDTSDGRGATHV